jgi:hypothetical protein
MRFVGLALAAGELPAAGKVHAPRAPCDEKRSIALDDRGRDDDQGTSLVAAHATRSFSGLNGNAAQAGRMGQIRHLGFRAVHKVAPKSINA